MVRYSEHNDFLREHLLFLMEGDRWKEAVNGAAESGCIRTEWTREWIEGHKGQQMVEALSEFVDERLLRICEIKSALWSGKGDKKPIEYIAEFRSLCDSAPILRASKSVAGYAAAVELEVEESENLIGFDFDCIFSLNRSRTSRK